MDKRSPPKLVRWDTPFAESLCPSVGLIISANPNGSDVLKAIVSAQDAYPKYLITFGEVIAFACFEEAHAPQRDFDSAICEEKNLCSFEYLNSPWLFKYSAWEPFYFNNETDVFYHYVIFGGDNNIEVITPNRPIIETISEKTVLKFELEI